MDSWETARHNEAGKDVLHLRLKEPSEIRFVSLSTKFHDGNQAEQVRITALMENGEWREVIPQAGDGGAFFCLHQGEPDAEGSRRQNRNFSGWRLDARWTLQRFASQHSGAFFRETALASISGKNSEIAQTADNSLSGRTRGDSA